MTASEAISRINEHIKIHLKKEPHAVHITEALQMACNALEKQMPKKFELFNGQCSCPNCNKVFGSYAQLKTLKHWEMPYCKYCGQALDWSDTE